nr:hypothetical protein [Tanacetum cinerariifolium]
DEDPEEDNLRKKILKKKKTIWKTRGVTEAKNPIEHKDETVPASVHEVDESSTALFCEDSDGLLPGLMRRDIHSLFGRIDSLSR